MSGIVEHLLDGRQGRATVLVLSGAEVSALLDLDELVEGLQAAMIDLSAGRASVPPRVAAQVPEHDAILAAMPAYLPSAVLPAPPPAPVAVPSSQPCVIARLQKTLSSFSCVLGPGAGLFLRGRRARRKSCGRRGA